MPAWIIPAASALFSALSGKLAKGPKEPTASPYIEAGANIVGGIANNLLARSNTKAQNEYNEPVNQIRRIRRAGLPYAAYSSGGAGNQSSATPTQDLGIEGAGKAIGDRFLRTGQMQQNELMMSTIEMAQQQAEQNRMFLDFLRSQNDSGTSNAWESYKADLERKKGEAAGAKQQAEGQRLQNIITKAQGKVADTLSQYQVGQAHQNLIQTIKRNTQIDAETEGILTENAIRNIIKEWQPEMSEAQYYNILQQTATGASQEALNKAAKALSDQNREIGAANFPVENLTKWVELEAKEIQRDYNLSEQQVKQVENDMLLRAQQVFTNGMTLQGISDILTYGSYQAMKAAAEKGELSATKLGKGAGEFFLTRGRGLK